MDAKEYLKQVPKLEKLIRNKQIEIERLWDIATGTSVNYGGERVQKSGRPQKMEGAICDYVDVQRELSETVSKLIRARQEVISTIEMLPPAEYDLLHKHYVQDIELRDLPVVYDGEDKPRSYSWVTTCHGRALQHVQRILDERNETN